MYDFSYVWSSYKFILVLIPYSDYGYIHTKEEYACPVCSVHLFKG